jgi:cyanophycinase-like exopeptidase
MTWLVARLSLAIFLTCSSLAPAASAKWKYWRTGNSEDSSVVPRTGFALMGGGAKQETAFQFLCERTNGGDFLILRAQPEEVYAETVNKEMFAMCPLNSVATIVFDDRENADDSKVVEIIDRAETIFIAGGDQSNYVRFWQGTPAQNALNRHIAAGKPIGGSSAGLAVLGNFRVTEFTDDGPHQVRLIPGNAPPSPITHSLEEIRNGKRRRARLGHYFAIERTRGYLPNLLRDERPNGH